MRFEKEDGACRPPNAKSALTGCTIGAQVEAGNACLTVGSVSVGMLDRIIVPQPVGQFPLGRNLKFHSGTSSAWEECEVEEVECEFS